MDPQLTGKEHDIDRSMLTLVLPFHTSLSRSHRPTYSTPNQHEGNQTTRHSFQLTLDKICWFPTIMYNCQPLPLGLCVLKLNHWTPNIYTAVMLLSGYHNLNPRGESATGTTGGPTPSLLADIPGRFDELNGRGRLTTIRSWSWERLLNRLSLLNRFSQGVKLALRNTGLRWSPRDLEMK